MLLAFSNTVAADVNDFEHAVADIPDAKALEADAIVLRVEASLWLALGSPSETLLEDLRAQALHVATRAPGIKVFLMPDGHTCAESSPAHSAHRPPMQLVDQAGVLTLSQANDAAVLAIRQQDLADCLQAARTRCVVCAASDYHFALPSGAHSNQFLRLAEAFVDLRTVDRIAFWIALDIQRRLEPLKSEYPVMLVDHPSMLVLAARVQLLVSNRLRVVAFPTYPSDVETRAAAFDELRRLPENCTQAFVLVGVASTGRLAKFIAQWNAPAHLKIHVSILYAVQPLEQADVFCNLQLPEYKHFASKEECDLCNAESTPVAIHSSNYMVGYAPADAIALPPSYFEKQKVFIDRWGKHAGVLRVHCNDPNEATARHHAFYVDVGTLLNYPGFVTEIEQKVATFDPPPPSCLVSRSCHCKANCKNCIGAPACSDRGGR